MVAEPTRSASSARNDSDVEEAYARAPEHAIAEVRGEGVVSAPPFEREGLEWARLFAWAAG